MSAPLTPDSPGRSTLLHGGCLCGAVAYTTPDDFRYAGYCHCTDCQQFSGSLFNAYGGVPRSTFVILRGAERIRRYAKNEESVLCFCGDCGSSLFADKLRMDMVHLRLGTLRDRQSLAPQHHVHVADKAPWYHITDGLPQYERGRTA